MVAPEATPRPAPRHIRSSLPPCGRPVGLGCPPSAPPAPDERLGLAPPIPFSRVPARYPFRCPACLRKEDRRRRRDAGGYRRRGGRSCGWSGPRARCRHQPDLGGPAPGRGRPVQHVSVLAAQRRAAWPVRPVPACRAAGPRWAVSTSRLVQPARPVAARGAVLAVRHVSAGATACPPSAACQAHAGGDPCAAAELDGNAAGELDGNADR